MALSAFALPTDVEPVVEKDTLGASYGPWETDVYLVTIAAAYLGQTDNGAHTVTFVFKNEKGTEYEETIRITSNDGSTTYTDKNSGKPVPQFGYQTVNNVCLMAIDVPLAELDEPVPKVIEKYDYTLRKNVPTTVPMLMDLVTGAPKLVLGIQKQLVNKHKLINGKWEPHAETREKNEIVKVFNEDGLSGPELAAGIKEPLFITDWIKKFKGVVRDRRTIKTDAPTEGATEGTPVPTKSLFG